MSTLRFTLCAVVLSVTFSTSALAQTTRSVAAPILGLEKAVPQAEALFARSDAQVFTSRATFADACGSLPTETFDEGEVLNGADLIQGPLDAEGTYIGVLGTIVFEPGDILPGLSVSTVSTTTGESGNLFVAGPGFGGSSSVTVGTTASLQNLAASFDPAVDCAGGFFNPVFDTPTEVQALDAAGTVLGRAVVTTEGFVGVRSTGSRVAALVAVLPESESVDTDDIAFGNAVGGVLSVALAPQSPTAVAPGGSVTFEYTVVNDTPSALSGGLFFYAERAGSTVARGAVATGTLAGGQRVVRFYDQAVPRAARPGEYDYFVCVGSGVDTPSACSDEVTITVGPAAGGTARDWAVVGAAPWLPSDLAAGARTSAAGAEVYPNPFARSTHLAFSLEQSTPVRLRIYDVRGREVASLADGTMEPGTHRVRFDAGSLPSGVYVYRLVAGQRVETGRITLAK